MGESVFVVTSVIAVTELLKRLEARDFRGALVIVVAAIIGVLSGFIGIENMTPVSGLMVGLGAAGIMRVGQAVGRGA